MIKQVCAENFVSGLDASNEKDSPGFVADDGLNPIYNSEWFMSFRRFANDIIYTFKPKSILEFGSGAGSLSKHIRNIEPSITYVSVDLNKDSKMKSPYYEGNRDNHFVGYTNKPLHFVNDKTNETIKFDLFLSFEHFEHIPPDTFDVLLENVKRHMHKDSLALTTACIEVREDGSHVNIKSKKAWVDYLSKMGFHTFDSSIINLQNQQFNIYGLWENTYELMFKLK